MSQKMQANDEILADLKAIFAEFVAEDFKGGNRWQGCEFAKALIGNALLGAIRQYEPDFKIPSEPRNG